jgi:hypothetical protein
VNLDRLRLGNSCGIGWGPTPLSCDCAKKGNFR